MNTELDYASNSDESDDDFRPEDLAVESSASEDEDSDVVDEDTEDIKKKPAKLKGTKKRIHKQKKTKHEEESDDENINTSTRSLRQKDIVNGKGQSMEKDELLSDEEDKSRTNALWADFLNDVNPSKTFSKAKPSKEENDASSSGLNGTQASGKTDKVKPNISLTSKKQENKNVLTDDSGFAGEEVSIQREIDASSIKENKAATILAGKKQPFSRIMPGAGMKRLAPTSATGTAHGLGSIINQLGKKKKLSVLEKSQMDWKCFKQSEGIDEQLQTFNKGKDGYLERQDFLQRTDLRQFEIEKNLRQTSRRPY